MKQRLVRLHHEAKRQHNQKRVHLQTFSSLSVLFGLLLFVPSLLPAETIALTWDDAWQMARTQNTEVLNSREEVTIAKEQINEARSGALPSLNLSGLYTRNLKSPVFFIDGQPIRIGLDNDYQAKIELTQPIWVAGKVGSALRIARSYLKQSETTVTQTLQDVRVQVAQTFYGVILAQELVKVTQTSLERAIQHRDQTRLMYEQGVVSEYDKIRAEVQVANLEPPLLQAQNQYQLTKENLRRILKLDPLSDVDVIGTLELADTTLPDANVETAFERRPELTALTHARKMQKELVGFTRRDLYLPSIYAIANYSASTQADNYEFDQYSWAKSAAAMVSVSIPLFDGFRTPAKVAQYRAELRRLDYTETDLRNGIRIDVENSRRELERALQTVRVQNDNVREAERGYQIAKVRYENGMGTQLELLDSELQLDNAKVNRLSALYSVKIARIQLERAMGFPLNN